MKDKNRNDKDIIISTITGKEVIAMINDLQNRIITLNITMQGIHDELKINNTTIKNNTDLITKHDTRIKSLELDRATIYGFCIIISILLGIVTPIISKFIFSKI